VLRTRVGYAGGTSQAPTYHNIGDHTETLQIDFDPSVIPYEKLAEVFFASHSPARQAWSRQYAAIGFWHDDAQRKVLEARLPAGARTEIRRYDGFTLAEEYHQKYYLQQYPELMREFRAMYPSFADFVASTAAARANGYLGGGGTAEGLQADIPLLGLSATGRDVVLKSARPRVKCGN